jgi:hypothetical protein
MPQPVVEKSGKAGVSHMLKDSQTTSSMFILPNSIPAPKSCTVQNSIFYRWFNKLRNSSLVLALDLIAPSMQLVVVDEAVFCTPRMTMHK